MYKHTANSIKETNEKMFISEEEKTLYDSYESTMRNIDDTYTKDEVDEIMKTTDESFVSLNSTTGVLELDDKYNKGFVEVVNVKGRTIQDADTLEVSAVGEPLGDGRYNLSLKSMNSGNLLNLNDSISGYNEMWIKTDAIRPVIGTSYNSMTYKYGERGLKVVADNVAVRGCGYIFIPSYTVDLYVKIKIVGNGHVSLKNQKNENMEYIKTSNQVVRFKIPANQGDIKIEIDAGASNDGEVIYDDIVISTSYIEDNNYWQEYQSDVIDIISPVQLHSGYKHNDPLERNLICDEMFIDNGKLKIRKNFKTVKLNDIIDTSVIETFRDDLYADYYRINIVFERKDIYGEMPNDYRLLSTVCDKLESTDTTSVLKTFIATEIYKVDKKAYFLVKIEKALADAQEGSTTVERIKNYLKSLNATITYELYGRETIEICDLDKLSLQLFENTIIDIQSSIKPRVIEAKAPASMGSIVSSNVSELDMLEKEIQSIGKLSNECVLESNLDSHLTIIKSNRGIGESITIKGKTHVNVLPHISKVYGRDNNDIFSRESDGSICWDTSRTTNLENHKFAYISNRYLKKLKSNTKYTLVANIKSNTMSKFVICDSGVNSNGTEVGNYVGKKTYYIPSNATGIVTTVIETKDDLESKNRIFALYSAAGVNGRIVIDELALYEGDICDEICMLKDATKMASVANNEPLKINSYSSKNLFDGRLVHGYIGDDTGNLVSVNHAVSSESFIACEGNEKYAIQINGVPEDVISNTVASRVYFYDLNKNYLGKEKISPVDAAINGKTSFIAPEHAKYMKFRIYNKDTNGKLSLNDYEITLIRKDNGRYNTITHDKHENNEVSIDLTKYGVEGGLKSLPDGKCDRIYKKNGKYYLEQVAGYVKLTSDIPDNRWFVSSLNTRFETIQCFIYRINENPDLLPPKVIEANQISNLHASILPAITPTNTGVVGNAEKQGVALSSNGPEFRIAVNKELLSTNDLAGFKKWLDENGGMEVIYELQTPRVIELEEDLDIYMYENETYINIQGGCATPNVSFKVNNHIKNVVKQMTEKVKYLEDEQISRIKLVLDSTYSADYSLHKTMIMTTSDSPINEIDNELIDIIKQYILSEEFDREQLETQIDLFTLIDKIDFKTSMELFDMIEEVCVEPEEIIL